MILEKLPIYIIIYIGLFLSIFYLLTFFESRVNQRIYRLKRKPSVNIIIPAFNEEKGIKETVNSVLSLDYDGKFKVIVVDDGSKDNTANVVKEIAKKDKRAILLTKPNGGKADAINFGIKKANSELIAILDADTIPKRDMLEKAISFFEDSNVAAVTCRTVPSNQNSFLTRMQYVEYTLVNFFRTLLTSMNSLQVVPAFCIFRSSFFKKHGGFDVGNLTEDLEMGLRVKDKGLDIAYVFDSHVKTKVPGGFKDLTRQRVRWGYGLLYNLKKYKHLFSPNYGDLGMFLMPATAITISVIIFMFFYALYNLSILTSQQISKVTILGWSFILSSSPSINLGLIMADPRIILGIFGFLLSLTVFFLARSHVKGELSFWGYLQYMFIYSWILAFFYILSVIHFLIKKPGW